MNGIKNSKNFIISLHESTPLCNTQCPYDDCAKYTLGYRPLIGEGGVEINVVIAPGEMVLE